MLPKLVRISEEKFDRLESRDPDTFYFVIKVGQNRGNFYIGDYLMGEASGITDESLVIKMNGTFINSFNGSQEVEIDITPESIGAQERLVSGTNIKTINNISLLGAGNIPIEGGEGNDFFMKQRFVNVSSLHVVHNSGKIPSVSIFDTANNEIFASFPSINEQYIDIEFSRNLSGTVYLN